MPDKFKELLKGNQSWVAEMKKSSPEIFTQMSQGQQPNFLWIGCADSRVHAEEVTKSLPGTIFVQRNIANMVVHTDNNMLSVVYYAIKYLSVKHIIVCGHYGCGGIKAAMSQDTFGLLDSWIGNIKEVYKLHRNELSSIDDQAARERRFVELNVQEQVNNVAKLAFIQEEWKKGEFPYIHGWVFNIDNGLLQNLDITVNSADHLEEVFRFSPVP